MKKHALHHMTWKEVEAAFSEDPVVLIPLGSMEEHGPHSLTGDFLAAAEVAKRTAEQLGVLYLPAVPFGCSEYFRGYPGTISLSPQTVQGLLTDICESLIEHNVTKIIFINGHAGNASTIEHVAREIKREKRLKVASLDLWRSLSPAFKQELYGENDPSGHGGEPLTSVMQYLYPADMRMDQLPNMERVCQWRDLDVSGLSKVRTDNTEYAIYFNMEELSSEGILGDPQAASAEKGEAIIDHIVHKAAAVVGMVKETDMRE
ncbi:creatininase family protein [Tuberibacillus sp. Marseille-P3662]|uniref:creatininase family protein n=1 Tax=Tuberibacillus sp. Marseille-P3662 TaxID=1965358 RepID=UPI000A1C8CDA|nr:creatininase family protein [Tuberibacillus sp. Marseille-P3662]